MSDAKHQDALKTIGEVADYFSLETHVLRFWEKKFPQIKPQKRRGRRYYSGDDIATIKTIKELLYEQGYTIKGVHKFLRNKKKPEPEIALNPVADNSPRDLFGNIIASVDDKKTLPEFGAAEIAKLRQIYKGLCAARNKLNL